MLIVAAPAAGQNGQQPQIITPPIGDFDLAPSRPTPTPAPVVTPTPTPAPTVAASRRPATATTSAPRSTPTPTRAEPPAAAQPAPTAPASTLTPDGPATFTPAPLSATPAARPTTGDEAGPESPGSADGSSFWLWIALGSAGLLALGGLAGWLFGRRRAGRNSADENAVPNGLTLPPPPPTPSPGPPPLAAARPRPAAPTPPPASTMVPPPEGALVTELRPLRASIRDGIVQVHFELFIQNRGSEPADNVRATLALLGANAQQDAQIAGFHASARMAAGSDPFSIAPGGVHMLAGQVGLPGDQMQVVTVQGKPMFVPIVPVALRWYAGLSIRTLRDAFMVGTVPAAGSDRLGPLWVERAGEGFGRLAAKRYAPKLPG